VDTFLVIFETPSGTLYDQTRNLYVFAKFFKTTLFAPSAPDFRSFVGEDEMKNEVV